MIPTFVGALLALVGLPLLILGSTTALLAFIMACGPMGGSAAVILTALGGSSVSPVDFALGLVMIRFITMQGGQALRVGDAIRQNWAFLAFAVYGAALAFIGPRLFAGTMDMPPLKFLYQRYIFAVSPLRPSSQNLTTSVYLIGTACVAVVSYAASGQRDGWRMLVRTATNIAWINLGVAYGDLATRGSSVNMVFLAFRNGSYAQLQNEYQGFIRITGIFPEASSFSAYTFVWFCFLFECWYRDIMPRRTGLIALAMFFTLIISTSSSAYVSLVGFGVLFIIRLGFPGAARSDKLVKIGGALAAGGVALCVFLLVDPPLAAKFWDMLLHMTVEKSQSYSGLQRAFWAKKGIEAFKSSYGLGIGPGSFRSSSLFSAILGSTGVIGTLLFVTSIVLILKPLRASTYAAVADPAVSVGIAASWAAFELLIPYGVSAASCDPGADFGILAGAALALRALPMLGQTVRQSAISSSIAEIHLAAPDLRISE